MKTVREGEDARALAQADGVAFAAKTGEDKFKELAHHQPEAQVVRPGGIH